MKADPLYRLAKSVQSRADFVKFVQSLALEARDRPDQWQNRELSEYLGAMSAFAEDMDGYFQNAGEVVDVERISWRLAAEMLLAASVYS